MLGYVHPKPPFGKCYKPTCFITDMEAANEMLSRYRCSGDHAHQWLDAGGTYHCATWPAQLDQVVLRVLEQQVEIDHSVDESSAFPVRKKELKVLMFPDHLDEPCIQKLADYEGKKVYISTLFVF